MTSTKFLARTGWIAVFLLYIAALAWLCFGNFKPDENIPRFILGIPIDKCVHFTMFLPFPILGTIAFRKNSWWRTLCWSTLAANFIAIVFESQQTRINPTRFTDAADLNANLAGIALGMLIMALVGLISKKK